VREGGGWRRLAAVGVAAAALAPLLPARPVPAERVQTPPFFTGGAVRQLPEGRVALVLPYANPGVSVAMTWQAEAGMRFRMPGWDGSQARAAGRPATRGGARRA
jgi:hypothetical protein